MKQFSLGAPVELYHIERELKKLWRDESDGAVSRASLINLAVYSEEPASLARNTQLVSQITENHACRALVIEANRANGEDRAQAWINAHCHMRGTSKQICSEQISFQLHGTKLLNSVLFSHLDSDLPLYLWWQTELRAPLDPQLWAWVDRLIYDSRDWRDFTPQMELARAAQGEAAQRDMVLCDLNWARLFHFRVAFAQFFDHPQARRELGQIQQVWLAFGHGSRSTAMLFVAWMAAQLEWETDGNGGFKAAEGKRVGIELIEQGDSSLESITVRTREEEFSVRRAQCGDLLEVSRARGGRNYAHQLLPGNDGEPATLLSHELMRGGTHRVYLRAVEKMSALS
ncbi:MAG: glucose-6-phosphate dehydrogenase assembly protein OpcA [Chthoniobacterales bacterium]